MAITYAQAARHFKARPVVLTMDDADRSTFVGTLHPCPQDGAEHVEIRCAYVTARCDVDDIADIRIHHSGRPATPAPPAAAVRRTRSGKIRS